MRKVIAYASRGLRPTERNMENYGTMKLELLALKWAVADKFKDYLLGSTFTVFTDNNPLTYLKTAKLGVVELRWAAQLPDFEFDIVHRTGKSNANADALSRRGTIGEVREQFRVPDPTVIPSEIRESYTVLVSTESANLEEEPTASSLTFPSYTSDEGRGGEGRGGEGRGGEGRGGEGRGGTEGRDGRAGGRAEGRTGGGKDGGTEVGRDAGRDGGTEGRRDGRREGRRERGRHGGTE